MALAIAQLIASMAAATGGGALTVHRPGAPTQNDYGGFDSAADVEVTIDPAAVHTVSGRELDQLPEADRTRETIQVYTTARLYVADGGQVADRIEWRDRMWRVVRVEDYAVQGGAWTALAVLEEAVP